MNPDIFRTGGMSFEQWVEANDLSQAPPEDVERFQSALASLQGNVALKFLLNGMEVEMMSKIYTSLTYGGENKREESYRELQAVRRFRQLLEAYVQDHAVSLQKQKK